MITRRKMITLLGTLPAGLYLQSILGCSDEKEFPPQLGSTVYKSFGEDTSKITKKLLESLGGIESLIDKNDIVILKPNAQWWLQGMTNTDVMSAFIDEILNIPGFDGEIIIAENHQDTTKDSRGWTTDKRNGRFNYNELVAYFNEKGYANVTKYHWHPAGPNPFPYQMGGSGKNVVTHPSEGDGYIWPKDLYYESPHGNKCILSYPVFTSSYSGTTIDLKDGAFKNGAYTDQPIKFINFSAINHHGKYAGITAAIKNMMGVVDMSCGYPCPRPDNFFNTHYVGASFLYQKLLYFADRLHDMPYYKDLLNNSSVFRFKHTGSVLGKYMKVVRKPDLHIITAINVGWGSRTDPTKAYKADTVLASTDPVALDFIASYQVLLEATKKVAASQFYLDLNDPSNKNNPFYHFLQECRRELGGTIEPNLIEVIDC